MQAQGGCGPTVNAIVCENLNPGNPASEWDISGRRRHHHPGFPDQYQHRARTTHLLQDQDNRQRLLDQHLSHGLLRRHGRPQGRDHLAVGVAAAESARLLDAGGDGPDRLRKLGRLRFVDRAQHRRIRDLLRATGAQRQRRRQPHHVHRPRRHAACRRGLPDLGHHVAGLQRLRRQQPVRGRTRHQPRSRLQSQLQPADPHAFGLQRAGLRVQRRVPDGALARGQWLRRQLRQRRRRRSRAEWTEHSPRPQGLPLGRPRRILVRPAAHQRRSRARRGREPRVSQRQRDLLEDALGKQQRRLEHAVPDARLLQRNQRQRQDRHRQPDDLDRHVGRSAVQSSGRRRPPAKCAERDALPGQ